MWLFYKIRRLWWKLFGEPIGPITSSEIGTQIIYTDLVIRTNNSKYIHQIMKGE